MILKRCRGGTACYQVCIHCYGIFHKRCVLNSKGKYSISEENKLICHNVENENTNGEMDQSQLEYAVNELSDDTYTKYIEKLKAEHNQFVEEAMKPEEVD
ncbi:hypothetical protein JTB14_023369 [Gonioctena quinquepunctata]|nr:hypothetical protein JTB14_023369 [Gonioctena quinquepunctata]